MDIINLSQLNFRNFYRLLLKLAKFRDYTRSAKGWVHQYRTNLGMSQAQLAKKMGIHQSNIKQLEDKESEGRANLQSLIKAADAMGAQLVYAFVPREDLLGVIQQAAEKTAKKLAEETLQNMALENQLMEKKEREKLVKRIQKELIATLDKRLWD